MPVLISPQHGQVRTISAGLGCQFSQNDRFENSFPCNNELRQIMSPRMPHALREHHHTTPHHTTALILCRNSSSPQCHWDLWVLTDSLHTHSMRGSKANHQTSLNQILDTTRQYLCPHSGNSSSPQCHWDLWVLPQPSND